MQSREITLSQSSIDWGRIYFAGSDQDFFPADSFSDRVTGGFKGTPVTFTAGGLLISSVIYQESALRINPRTTFDPFLKATKAAYGDTLFVERISERTYRVTHRPKVIP